MSSKKKERSTHTLFGLSKREQTVSNGFVRLKMLEHLLTISLTLANEKLTELHKGNKKCEENENAIKTIQCN